ncbi:hypothetical protein [Mangrovibacterium sp.]|uniref:hypothetical protein n=1 Tax=Mangrovibacterium sp. TaxID=1961364 RepID=UPI0035651EFB
MKEAIDILTAEMQKSMHLSKYPQDKHTEKKATIDVLLSTSDYHKKRAEELKKAIDVLKDELN